MTDFPVHSISIRVYWENTDAGGRVYHTQYMAFAERGRTEWLRHVMGLNQTDIIAKTGVTFVVKSLTTDFIGYAVLDDTLVVKTHMHSIKGAKMLFDQYILNGDTVIVTLQVLVVCVGKKGMPVRMPKYIMRLQPLATQWHCGAEQG